MQGRRPKREIWPGRFCQSMNSEIKLLFSLVAIALTFIAFVPYIAAIIKGNARPHVFSWVIWGMTTTIVFFAQREAHGGIGAWPIGISGSITIVIAMLAFNQRADISITALDWLFFIVALASLCFWYFTDEPLWTVILLTTVDLLGFGPTIRKAYHQPYQESLSFFSMFMLRNICALLALEQYSVTTALFPAAVAAACVLLLGMIVYRRRVQRSAVYRTSV